MGQHRQKQHHVNKPPAKGFTTCPSGITPKGTKYNENCPLWCFCDRCPEGHKPGGSYSDAQCLHLGGSHVGVWFAFFQMFIYVS